MPIRFLILVSWLALTTFTPAPKHCPGPAEIEVQPGFALNIRAEAGGVSQRVGTLENKDGWKRSPESVNASGQEYFRIENGDKSGWVIGKYLSIICVSPTSTPTPTPTQTPHPTPTRIPAGTPAPGAWFCDPYGCVYLTYPVTIQEHRPR